jgi:ABC-type multidrug transport system ATPase subunit
MALMKIKLSDAGKRFNREWIFRHTDLEFNSGQAYAITGPNGSGKSTLLQSIAGVLQLSEGSIEYAIGNRQLASENAYKSMSFCAPYLDVIEEMTLTEFLQFHSRFKPLIDGHSVNSITEAIELSGASLKQIRYYSSGMKQRVKLAQAVFSDTSLVLLDEPCTNLDDRGIELYHRLIGDYCQDRLVIVCSNNEVEYRFTQQRISVLDYKQTVRQR